MPVMLAELITAIWLVFAESEFTGEFIAGAVLLALIWISTALIQVPSHSRLSDGYSRTEVERLVTYNWIRTILWTMRLAVLLAILYQLSSFDL